MTIPHANWRLWKRAAQFGGLLMILVGFLWIFGDTFSVYVPPQRGLVTEEAIVISLDQRGTFQEPAFAVTLSYEIEEADGSMTTIRSGQRLEYETYSRLSLEDVVIIRFDPIAPHDWTLLTMPNNDPTRNMIPATLMIGGLLLALLPWLLQLGSRAGDFENDNGEHLHIS